MSGKVSALVFAVIIAVSAIFVLLDERVSIQSLASYFADDDKNPPN